jgi:hypothetical protein
VQSATFDDRVPVFRTREIWTDVKVWTGESHNALVFAAGEFTRSTWELGHPRRDAQEFPMLYVVVRTARSRVGGEAGGDGVVSTPSGSPDIGNSGQDLPGRAAVL